MQPDAYMELASALTAKKKETNKTYKELSEGSNCNPYHLCLLHSGKIPTHFHRFTSPEVLNSLARNYKISVFELLSAAGFSDVDKSLKIEWLKKELSKLKNRDPLSALKWLRAEMIDVLENFEQELKETYVADDIIGEALGLEDEYEEELEEDDYTEEDTIDTLEE